MRSFSKLKPFSLDGDGRVKLWDPGLIIQHWADQPDNDLLMNSELALKAFALLAIAVSPQCSDAANVVRSTIQFSPDGRDLVFG